MRTCLVGFLVTVTAAILALPASSITRPQKLSFVDVTESNHVIGGFEFNRPPTGGDSFASSDALYKWAGTKRGARAGRLETYCTVMYASPAGFSAFCTGQAFLPAGSVLAQGFVHFPFDGPAKFTLPVVGGTGSYANGRGFVRFRNLGDGSGNASGLELDLTP